MPTKDTNVPWSIACHGNRIPQARRLYMLKVYSPQSKMEEQYLDNEGLSQGLLSAS